MLNYNYINGVNSEGEIIEIDAFPGAGGKDPKVVLNYTTEGTPVGTPIQHRLEQIGLASFAQTLAGYLVDMFYPVGTIYCTKLKNADPNQLFPGTEWNRVAADRYLKGTDENSGAPVATDGGAKSFTLTNAQLPAHTHGITGGTQSTKITGTTKEGEGSHYHPVNTWVINAFLNQKVTNNNDSVLQIPQCTAYNAVALAQDTAGNIYGTHTHTFDATIDVTLPTSTKSAGSGAAVNLNPLYYGCYMWLRIK